MPSSKSLAQVETDLRKALARRCEPGTITQFCVYLRQFCNVTKKTGDWDKKDVIKYLDWVAEQGYTSKTILSSYYGVKSIHDYLDLPFPTLKVRDLPRVSARPIARPFLELEEAEAMISWVKDFGNDLEKLMVAMSSVYGLRRVEMSTLTKESFNQPGRVFIQTAKHGVPREHVIPEILDKFIQPGIKYLPVGTVHSLTVLYNQISEKMGRARGNREGWHSFRRTLASALVRAGFSEIEIKHFMRWSDNTSMVFIYTSSLRDDDSRVFDRHPMLRMWG